MKLSFDTYARYGLTQNPFLVHALRADEQGRRLLVGRDELIQSVAEMLHKHGKITCLDGHIGVGKTSLVNVAAFECFQAFLSGETTQLLIPMSDAFQLGKDEDVSTFCTKVFRRVAQTLLEYREQLNGYDGSEAIANRLAPWINSPVVKHLNGSVGLTGSLGLPGVASVGIKGDGTSSSQLNTGAGFVEQGFEQLVRQWLNEIFSVQGNGGVVCVIDNLELLETGINARRTLEQLRDSLFTVNGLRWVFCGANGVVSSLVASPRLGAYLNSPPIEVGQLKQSAIEPLFLARLAEFSLNPDKGGATLPIRVCDLERLYYIVNCNLRDLLARADEYCEHLFGRGKAPVDDAEKEQLFRKWLEARTASVYSALFSRVPTDSWAILDIAMTSQYGGTFGVGDYGSFNANSKIALAESTFEKRLRDLVKHGLLTKSIDDEKDGDDGFRRDVFSVTAKGSMVHYARLIRSETLSLLPDTSWLKTVHGDKTR